MGEMMQLVLNDGFKRNEDSERFANKVMETKELNLYTSGLE